MLRRLNVILVLVILALVATACLEKQDSQQDVNGTPGNVGVATMGPGEEGGVSSTPRAVSTEELEEREKLLDRTHGSGPPLPTGEAPDN